jgi:hypothetical protein
MNEATNGHLEKHQLREAADDLRDAKAKRNRTDQKLDQDYENAASRPYRKTPDPSPLMASEEAVRAAEKRLGKLLAESPLSPEEKSEVTGLDPAELARLEALAD